MESRGEALLRRGRMALGTGAIAGAIKDIEAAYAQALADKDRALEAESLVELSRGLIARNTHEQALLCIEQAIETAHAAGLSGVQADAHMVEAELLVLLEDATRAR